MRVLDLIVAIKDIKPTPNSPSRMHHPQSTLLYIINFMIAQDESWIDIFRHKIAEFCVIMYKLISWGCPGGTGADVLYYVVALANLYEVDLQQCFELKEALNAQKYSKAD